MGLLQEKIEELVGATPTKDNKSLRKLGLLELDIIDIVMHLEDLELIFIYGDIPEDSILNMTVSEFKDYLLGKSC